MIGWSLLVLLVAGVVLAGFKATRSGYESAPCQVVRAAGEIEVRDFRALTVVETPMTRSGNGVDGSFNRLFRLKP